MNIEIINTGNELLLGTTLNTHGAWLGSELAMHGLRVQRQTTIPDGGAILPALKEAMHRSDAVIITGGLGPTSDDLTREATAEALGVDMIYDEAALRSIEAFFAHRERAMAEENKKQALNPVGADILPNPNGTAPGTYCPPRMSGDHLCALFLLPGPPREMQPMFHNEVVPRLRSLAGVHTKNDVCVLRFTGIGESDFHSVLDHSLTEIDNLEVGYCARAAEVDLRLIGSEDAIARGAELALNAFPEECFSHTSESLEEVVVKKLHDRGMKLSLAESCTGGAVASRVTDIPGSSEIFTHGFVTYSNQAKLQLLGINETLLHKHGEVSKEVAIAMAEGALARSGADIAVAITGIAGPSGGTEDKPVGTVWIGLATPHKRIAIKKYHPQGREYFKRAVSQNALDLIRRELDK